MKVWYLVLIFLGHHDYEVVKIPTSSIQECEKGRQSFNALYPESRWNFNKSFCVEGWK